MKDNMIAFTLTTLALGAGLVAYAHASFTTKLELESLRAIVERIDNRVYKMAVKEGVEGGHH